MVFWTLAALLAAVALWRILPPLLGRGIAPRASQAEANLAIYRQKLKELKADREAGVLEDEQYQQARRELEADLAEDLQGADPAVDARSRGRWAAYVAGPLVVVLALALYLQLGTPEPPMENPLLSQSLPEDPQARAQMIESMVADLEQRLEEDPDNPQGWAMLARSYQVMERFAEAARAYARLAERVGDDPNVLADWAEAEALAAEGRMAGRPAQLLTKVLELDPEHAKALWLGGMAALQEGNRALAQQRLDRLLAQMPEDDSEALRMKEMIRRIMQEAGLEVAQATLPGPRRERIADAGAALRVRVELDPQLAARVAPDDTVFVLARAEGGPRAPLAVVRRQAGELPLELSLDDSMAMVPEMRLSSFPRVVVAALVSKSGSA
ncbi:MAG: c-type cytochrome biogenesis protein CcmI, partial [Candidatus Competibacteraceae bacterium]|nr:c-type cytochrome biogenesis protein CcmI [Candidatus Competibacteraceae bacterium]